VGLKHRPGRGLKDLKRICMQEKKVAFKKGDDQGSRVDTVVGWEYCRWKRTGGENKTLLEEGVNFRKEKKTSRYRRQVSSIVWWCPFGN